MATYSYTKAGVDAYQLGVELVASGITTTLDYVNTTDDVVDVVFLNTLSGTEWTTLSGVVDAHVAGTCDQFVKIHRYIEESESYDLYDPPIEHNYVSGLTTRLYPKRLMTKGEVTCVEYYADEALTDKILCVDIEYNRDALYLATDRTVVRKWVKEDGKMHSVTKVTNKNYTINIDDQSKEAHRRRQNIIDMLMLVVLGMMQQTMPEESMTDILTDGRAFAKDYRIEFDTYVEVGGPDLAVTISGATVSGITGVWIDNVINASGTTIRQYMMNEVT